MSASSTCPSTKNRLRSAGSFILGCFLAGLLAPAPALAELPRSKFYGRIGALAANADTRVRIDVPGIGASGTLIDFERDLGLKDREWLPAGEVGILLGKNWRAEFEFWTIDRRNSASIERSITVEDLTFDAGASVADRFASTLYNVDLHWMPINKPNAELGFSFGLHMTDFRLSLEGEASLGQTVGFRQVAKSQLAPLPTLGTNGRIRIAPDVMLIGQFEIFALEVGDYRGRLIDAEAGITWKVARHIGIGASIRTLDYSLRVNRDRWKGRVDYDLTGPSLFLTYGF